MAAPKRPVASPPIIHGTTIRRTYVAPRPGEKVELGDIVAWGDHQWDVVGISALGPPDPNGDQPLRLMLERLERPPGRRKKVVREHAAASEVRVVGHQVLMPGMPQPEVAPRPEDRT
jgi:hypothetical protein